MKYDSVIFDLDGTLLNTLDDLCDSVNFTLRKHNMPERTLSEVRSFVGDGIRNLVCRSAVPNTSEEQIDRMLATFKEHYKDHNSDKTKPYEGIIELLSELKKNGIPTAVVSNKVDIAVKMLVSGYFGSLVDIAIGELEGGKRKPSPDTVFLAMEKLSSKNPVYIGDSQVDVQTAKNAGIDGIFVTWGFRDESVLKQAGGEHIVHSVKELWEVLF